MHPPRLTKSRVSAPFLFGTVVHSSNANATAAVGMTEVEKIGRRKVYSALVSPGASAGAAASSLGASAAA